jgi:GH15 family glucan-1,4-alpha-glucosidase
MPSRIEDYALIGNTRTAALVARNGSIDWWCLPRFDGRACFAALLGRREHGHFSLAPAGRHRSVRRRYRAQTLILETEFDTDDGTVRLTDCMPLWPDRMDIVRIVEGVRGRVPMRMDLVMRFGYGVVIPWVRRVDGALLATAGPDSILLHTPVPTRGERYTTVAEFNVARGERVPFVLTHFASHLARPLPIDPFAALDETEIAWRAWCDQCTYQGRWADAVKTSLVVLKALTYAPTGGIVAAPTTSLPEQLGGVRNWDYRFCWLRDATFTLYALLLSGYRDEARAWREWLLRAAAGRPEDLQVLYGVAGERQFVEMELPWLPGFRKSAPVRIGNRAATQFQLDVYGEVVDAFSLARAAGLEQNADAWSFQRALLDFLESNWESPDNGIWEMRGERQHFTHSKVLAWAALDRGIQSVERFRLEGPVRRWRALREKIHDTVCRRGYDARRNTFVQRFGARDLDASLLQIPLVGFLPATDRRIQGTIAAIERELVRGGFVIRYATTRGLDGLPPHEGAFLPCSFWLVDNLALVGRQADAIRLFERLLKLRNDVGLLAEEYDPRGRRLLGNFPQALTHVALINTARNLSHPGGPSEHRGSGMSDVPPGAAEGAPQPRGTRRSRGKR